MPEQKKKLLFPFVNWKAVRKQYGVVVALDAEPNNLLDQSIYPGISFQTMKARLRDNHFASPEKLWRACKETPLARTSQKVHEVIQATSGR